MNEITEREQKLLDIIRWLFSALSLRTIALYKIYSLIAWENDMTGKEGFDTKQREAMTYLNSEFGLDFHEVKPNGDKIEVDKVSDKS